MNFLGMGPMELVLILVLALIVFGPGKLPEIAGQVGKMVRDFRRTSSEMTSEFNRALSLEVEERQQAAASPTVAQSTPVTGATEPAASALPASGTSETTSTDAAATATSPPQSSDGPGDAAAARPKRQDDLLPPY